MTFSDLLAILVVVVAMPLTLFVSYRQGRLSDTAAPPRVRILRAVAFSSLGRAVIVVAFAATFVNNDLPAPPLDVEATRVLTRGVLVVVPIALAAYWLRLERRS